MKRHVFAVVVLSLVLCGIYLSAQDSSENTHGPGGGTVEMMTSIFISPLPNAPFTSTVTAEWTRTLEDGSTLTLQNHRMVVRDRAGRIYQERRSLVPNGGQHQPELRRIEISDPVSHRKYFCIARARTCELEDYFVSTSAPALPLGTSNTSEGTLTREDLGKSSLDGLEVVGTRETTIVNFGTVGNDHPLTITSEFWHSKQLDLDLMVKRVDPRHGTQAITVTDLSLTDPDPKLFELPAGFKIVDQRSAHASLPKRTSHN